MNVRLFRRFISLGQKQADAEKFNGYLSAFFTCWWYLEIYCLKSRNSELYWVTGISTVPGRQSCPCFCSSFHPAASPSIAKIPQVAIMRKKGINMFACLEPRYFCHVLPFKSIFKESIALPLKLVGCIVLMISVLICVLVHFSFGSVAGDNSCPSSMLLSIHESWQYMKWNKIKLVFAWE